MTVVLNNIEIKYMDYTYDGELSIILEGEQLEQLESLKGKTVNFTIWEVPSEK